MFTLTYLRCMCAYKHGYIYVYIGGLHAPHHPSNSIHIHGFHYHLQKVTHRCVSPAQTSPLSSGPIWYLRKLNTHHFIILLPLSFMRKAEVKESLSPFHVCFFFPSPPCTEQYKTEIWVTVFPSFSFILNVQSTTVSCAFYLVYFSGPAHQPHLLPCHRPSQRGVQVWCFPLQ